MSSVQEEFSRLVKLLVDEPDEVEVVEAVSGRNIVFELSVAQNDLGKVIGRQGRTARALRSLLAERGAREGERYELEILD